MRQSFGFSFNVFRYREEEGEESNPLKKWLDLTTTGCPVARHYETRAPRSRLGDPQKQTDQDLVRQE